MNIYKTTEEKNANLLDRLNLLKHICSKTGKDFCISIDEKGSGDEIKLEIFNPEAEKEAGKELVCVVKLLPETYPNDAISVLLAWVDKMFWKQIKEASNESGSAEGNT